jgi:hypothetical protein
MMKSRLMSIALVCAISMSVSVPAAHSQVADSTVWALFAANGAQPAASANLTADSNLVGPAAGWVKASYNANGQRCNLGAAGWPAAETDTAAGRYVEFTTGAVAGRSLTVTNISFNYGGAASTNAVRAKVFYSIDNWTTKNLVTTDSALLYPNSTMTSFSKALNVKLPAAARFSLRVYPYWVGSAAGSSSKYSVLNTMVISGTTQPSTGITGTGMRTPAGFDLLQNYPNPFNPSTQITFTLASANYTTLKVYDIIGTEVATLVDGVLPAGSYTAPFSASHLPSGVFMSVLSSGGQKITKRMVLMK